MLSIQVRNPVGLLVPGRYIGGSSTGLSKAQALKVHSGPTGYQTRVSVATEEGRNVQIQIVLFNIIVHNIHNIQEAHTVK